MPTFTVPGPPIPQPRASVSRTGHRYYPNNGIAGYRRAIQTAARPHFKTPISTFVEMHIVMVFKRPPSHYTKTGKLTAAATRRKYPTHCDGDNIIKGVQDALNGVAYTDDRLIAFKSGRKIYGPTAQTEIVITTLK